MRWLLAFFAASSCWANPRVAGEARAAALSRVGHFTIQLQHVDPGAIADTAFDLVVIDYSRDGSAAQEFSRSEVERMRAGGRIVLAYLSIGEAESYRFYWKRDYRTGRPAWLGRPNPDWPGNSKVKFWDPQWQRILLAYVDRILAQGFDGVWLDVVDAWWYWAHDARSRGENEVLAEADAAERMVRLIERIAEHGRSRRPGGRFLVIPQNGTDLIDAVPPATLEAFWAAIDGVASEDTFFYGGAAHDNPLAPQADVIARLHRFSARGKRVFIIDYLSPSRQRDIDRLYDLARERGWLAYAASRSLDRLRVNPGHEPR